MAMDKIRDGWFSEINDMWPGQALSLEVEEVLMHEKSDFQDVMIIKTKKHGNALVLDGVIQLTESDECAYQEMCAHVPLNAHPNPEKVLIIGGGDGGVAREFAKDPRVKQIIQCEIDELVVTASKKYLPGMAKGYDSPKHTLIIGDGFEYMKKHEGDFDVIITDSSDPVGPASTLFGKDYYERVKKALKPGGIVASQGECLWLHLDLIRDMTVFCSDIFPSVSYYYTCVPTYPSGQLGFMLCSIEENKDFSKPVRTMTEEEVDQMDLKYYNSDIHSASFVLPQFAKKRLEAARK